MNKQIFSILMLCAALASGQGRHRLTGVITDSMCANGDHSQMRMGSNDAECTLACIDGHGASFVLYDGKQVYFLSDQKMPEKFAGKRVVVTGTLDSAKKILRVEAITLAAGAR